MWAGRSTGLCTTVLSKRLSSDLEKAIEECLQAMSAQRHQESAAMVESLSTELAERNTVIVHLEERTAAEGAPPAADLRRSCSCCSSSACGTQLLNRPMPNQDGQDASPHAPQRLVENSQEHALPSAAGPGELWKPCSGIASDEHGPSKRWHASRVLWERLCARSLLQMMYAERGRDTVMSLMDPTWQLIDRDGR